MSAYHNSLVGMSKPWPLFLIFTDCTTSKTSSFIKVYNQFRLVSPCEIILHSSSQTETFDGINKVKHRKEYSLLARSQSC
jgi:hypothetical protein